jgi:hypothetical protein
VASHLPSTEDDDRVIPFRSRRGPRQNWRFSLTKFAPRKTPVANLEKFERVEPEDDYRHRMIMNVLGLLVSIVLILAGLWLAERIANMVSTQDCFISGRRNCAPIDLHPPGKS